LPPLRLMARLLTGAQTNADEPVARALGRAIHSPDSLAHHASPFGWLASLLEQDWTESLHRRQH
jgi:DNA-directed RNA polymerase specialized sigma24 family protein